MDSHLAFHSICKQYKSNSTEDAPENQLFQVLVTKLMWCNFYRDYFKEKLQELRWHLSFPIPIPNRPITIIWQLLTAPAMPIIPTIKNTGIAITAGIHLVCATPNICLGAEFYTSAYVLGVEVLNEPVRLDGGMSHLPPGPGLGIVVDEKALADVTEQVWT